MQAPDKKIGQLKEATKKSLVTSEHQQQQQQHNKDVFGHGQPGQFGRRLHWDGDEEMEDEDIYLESGKKTSSAPAAVPPFSHQLVMSKELSTRKVQNMKASFFPSVATAPPTFPPLIGAGNLRSMKPIANSNASLLNTSGHSLLNTSMRAEYPMHNMADGGSGAGSTALFLFPPHTATANTAPPTSNSQFIKPPSLVQPMGSTGLMVPPARALTRGMEGCRRDAGICFGRSFRVGWGPNWMLAHSGASVGKSDSTKPRGGLFSSQPIAQTLAGVLDDVQPVRVVIEKLSVVPEKQHHEVL